MSTVVSFTVVPESNQAMRWARALDRAKSAGVQAVRLDDERFVVTSATVPGIAYIATEQTCGCMAAQRGDAVCLHRAIVKHLIASPPDPEPPKHQAYDPGAEALQWAYNDRDRAYRDLERYTAKIERGEVLNDREWAEFIRAQEREQDAHRRIVELNSTLSMAASEGMYPMGAVA